MRARVWCMSLVLVGLGVACGDQPTEVVVDREIEDPAVVDQQTESGVGMSQAPGFLAHATASSEDGRTISTDKDDYQPGDTVYLSGSGWPANDTLDILLEDEPATHNPINWWVPVQGDGSFRDSTYLVDEGDLDVTFTLTATSRSSGQSLVVTFTDGQPQSVSLDPTSRTIAQGGTATYDVDVNMVGSSGACTVTLQVLSGLPAGASASFSGNPFELPNGSGDDDIASVLTITTTVATSAGTHNFTVQATRGANCQGSGNGPTVTGALIVFGAANKLAFGQQPTDEQSTTPIAPAVTVRVLDAGNNLVANSSAPVTLSLGTNPGSGTLGGTLTQNAVNGIATFANLTIDKIGTGYTLVAGSPGLTGAASSTFNILLGPATKLAFFTQPSGGAPNIAFTTQPRVEVQDAGGNRRTAGASSNAPITLAIVSGTGIPGAALSCGSNPLAAIGGLATFTNCRISLAGTGYRLRATSGALTPADSDPFDVAAVNQPPSVNAGGPYTVGEGTELTLNPTVTDADNDPLVYQWTVTTTGIDAGGTCTFDNAASKNAKVTCTDDSQGTPSGKFTLTLEVDDGTAAPVSDNADLTVTNANPVANASGPYSGDEGSPIALSGSGDDPGAHDDGHLGYQWTVVTTGIDAGGVCSFNNSASKNAEVTCTDDGSFKVRLVVSDDDGGTSVASEADLTVANLAPTATAGGPYSGEEGSAIPLSGSGNDPGDNDDPDLTYKWTAVTTGIDAGGTCTFDDDASKTAKVTCTDDGAFKVRLVVEDDDNGTSATSEADLTVGNAGPVADAGGPYDGNEGSPVQLNGTVTDAGSNDTHVWLWQYVSGAGIDGGTCSFDNANAQDPKITCTDDGTVQLTLKVTDDDGSDSQDTATLTLANVNPVANAGGSYSGNEGSAVHLNGSVMDAGTNDTHTWSWQYVGTSVDPGATCSFSNPSAEDPSVTCTDDGTVKLTLTVTDDDGGSDSDEATLTLANVAPTAEAGGPSYTTVEGTAFALNGSATDPGSNDVITYKWTKSVSWVAASGTCTFDDDTKKDARITCTDDAVVTLTLKATDDEGDFTTDQATLTVANADPVANAGPDYTGSEGAAVQLNGSVTDAGTNDTHTWSWKYVAGSGVDAGATCGFSNPAAEDPTITCTDDGTVELTLEVTDDDGGKGTDKAYLTLANVAPVASAGTYAAGVEGTAITLNGSATDQGSNDTQTFKWTVDNSGIDGGGSCAISDDTNPSASITCNDNGTLKVSLVATDDDGGISSASQASITIANANPVIATFTKSDGTPLPPTLIVAGTLGLRATFSDAGTNDDHTADVDCGSGSFSALGAAGSPVATSCTFATVGPKTIRLKVTDDDGGYHIVSHTMTVKYDFAGFYAPVDPLPTMNVSKAGQAIPLKWTLRDATGAPVTDLATVTIKAVSVPCAAGVTSDQVEEYAAGSSGLQNHGGGNYQFNWKTPTSYASSCKNIELVFGSGGLSYTEGPHASFSFKK